MASLRARPKRHAPKLWKPCIERLALPGYPLRVETHVVAVDDTTSGDLAIACPKNLSRN